jgi:hypothetical protein
VPGVSPDRPREPDHLTGEDRRPGDQPEPTDQRAGPDRPEPAKREAEPEPVGKRLEPAVPADVLDPGLFDESDQAASLTDCREQGDLVDFAG